MSTSRKGTLLVLAVVLVLVGAAVRAPDANATIPPPKYVVAGGIRLQIRGDRPHSFGSCVPQPVTHFHIEIFQSIGGGRYKYLSNFHIGRYTASKSCYVVWNNYKPAICFKSCGGRTELQAVLKQALWIATVAIGVTLSATVIALLAAGATAVLYPIL